MTPTAEDRWSDLRTRLSSALVMVIFGGLAIWVGGRAFAALAIVLTSLMLWELATMTSEKSHDRNRISVTVAALAGAALAAALALRSEIAGLFLIAPTLMLAFTPRRDQQLAAGYAAAIMVAGFGLISLRNEAGAPAIVWLVLVVVTSDVMGYFAGRLLGGPKFWPKVSPKKTWSGTVAGWLGAAVVGGLFWLGGWGTALLIPLSALVAFAGQMGDIGESWIKRRAGVKDASSLIPGHGGVLDRFDALIGAVVLVMLIELVCPVAPVIGG